MSWVDCSIRRGVRSLGADTVARLSDAIAGSLHMVYVIAGALAVLTLIVTVLLPAKLGPAQSARQ